MSFRIKHNIIVVFVLLINLAVAQNKYVDSLINVAETTDVDTLKINAFLKISNRLKSTNFDESYKYAKQALAIAEKIDNENYLAKVNRHLGRLSIDEGNVGGAAKYFFKALELDKQANNIHGLAMDYNSVGDIYKSQKRFDDALNSYTKALEMNRQLDSQRQMAICYNNVGIIYATTKKYKQALLCYDSTLLISEKFKNKRRTASTYLNKSRVYRDMGNLDKAIELSQKAIEINQQIGNPNRLLECYNELADLYLINAQYEDAFTVLEKESEFEPKVIEKDLIKDFYDNYTILYKEKGNIEKAYEYAKKALALKDSIHHESNNRLAIETTAKYDSDQHVLQIASLEKDNELSLGLIKRERNFRIFITLLVLVIITFLLLLTKRLIQKRKKNKELASSFDLIEKKKQGIADSINYSKRIQDSILPSKQLKNRLFHDIFVLFMPKDIVSGDFYWYAEKNGKKIVACCDCTGHGVPGSLMSMIGNNILNHLVHDLGITSADEILNQLHQEIRKALKQDMQLKSMDGMDLALIVFNSETQIEYAGAHRALWIINKEQPETPQLVEVKANKFSIGGYQSEEIRQFTKHNIELQKGDCLYMFTDGYADQFGGKEGKKFMTKRLRELLLANYHKPIPEQEQIFTKAIIDWKGNHEQVDDILMIAIRV
jgi:serine phosphatase RsbU (regulator of sigma subunit)/Flp pilus assembly protein TadD